MTRSWGWLAFVLVVAVIAIGASIGLGYVSLEAATIVLAGFVLIAWIVFRMAGSRDRWFPGLALVGYAAKVAGAALHFWTVRVVYDGVADAVGYHDRALALVEVWRDFQIPKSDFGSAGTRFVTEATAFLYTPYRPSLLGGFLIFATLGFFGQLLLYAAFRRALPSGRLKLYAIGIFFLPSLVFWPSTIGKDALMLLFLGLLGYGISRFLLDYRMRWFLVLAAGGAGSVAIRPHVAALAAGAIVIAVVLGRRPQVRAAGLRWGLLATAGVLAAALVATQASDSLGVDISGQNLDPLLQDIERNTSRGGSAVEGEAVLTLRQLPGGVMRVLFRPLPFEADTTQGMLSAIESTLLLVVVLWRSPRVLLAFRRLRRNPYLLFSMLFVIGFVVVFSAIFNLGILARQRSQALPFLLALIVGMGWEPETEPDETVEPQLVRTR